MNDARLKYEKGRFASELHSMAQRQQQDAEAFLEALLQAAAPALLESKQAVVTVGSNQVAAVAQLLLAKHGHANIAVRVAAPAPITKAARKQARKAIW
jgi:cytochrome c-type biogenesis protein CcmE